MTKLTRNASKVQLFGDVGGGFEIEKSQAVQKGNSVKAKIGACEKLKRRRIMLDQFPSEAFSERGFDGELTACLQSTTFLVFWVTWDKS